MKKLILLFTITCAAGQIYGMEPEISMEPENLYKTLPKELKQEIINTALATTNTIPEAINAIKKLSILHNIRYDNLQNAPALVRALTKKFPDKSREEIILALEKPEAYKELVTIFETNKTPGGIYAAIKNQNILQDNLKDFIALVHILADKGIELIGNSILDRSTLMIARQFHTPIAEEYNRLGNTLLFSVKLGRLEKVVQLIQDGADVNFVNYDNTSSLTTALRSEFLSIDMVKLLLAHGADPNQEFVQFALITFDQLRGTTVYSPSHIEKMNEIEPLLKEAMKK